MTTEWLYGKNSVREALIAARRPFRRLLLSASSEQDVQDIRVRAQALRLTVERVERRDLDQRLCHRHHQGVVLECGGYPYDDLESCIERAHAARRTPLLLLLDHVQDPQNVGTLLRTAEAVQVDAVVLPQRRAAAITPAVVNASSGATEHLSVVNGNIAQTIAQIQRAGVWVVGVQQDVAAHPYDEAGVNYRGALALVLGAESSGLAHLTRKRCDTLVALPMAGRVASLNVAVAGSILLYHCWRQRAIAAADSP